MFEHVDKDKRDVFAVDFVIDFTHYGFAEWTAQQWRE